MLRTTALPTALALATVLSASPATAGPPTLLVEDHYRQDGYQVDLYVTDGPDGQLTEATFTNATRGDAVDMWTDGVTFYWYGTIDGEPYCFPPVTAVLCLGVVLLATCATTINACPDRETVDPSEGIPGGGGGVPQDPGGGGDGESEGDGGDGDGDGD